MTNSGAKVEATIVRKNYHYLLNYSSFFFAVNKIKDTFKVEMARHKTEEKVPRSLQTDLRYMDLVSGSGIRTM